MALPFNGALPSWLLPSMKFTVPAGVPAVEVTVAVSVSVGAPEFEFDDNAVVVPLGA